MSTTPPTRVAPAGAPRPRPNYALRRAVVGGRRPARAPGGRAGGERTRSAAAPTARGTHHDARAGRRPPRRPGTDHHHARLPPPQRPHPAPGVRRAHPAGAGRVRGAPLTVWVLGDSTAQALGQLLENDVAGRPVDLGPHDPQELVRADPPGLLRLAGRAARRTSPRARPTPWWSRWATTTPRPLQPEGSTGLRRRRRSPAWIAEYTRRLTAFVGQLTAARQPRLPRRPAGRCATAPSTPGSPWSTAPTAPWPPPTPTSPTSTRGRCSSDDAGGYTDRLPGAGGAMVAGAQRRRHPPVARGRPVAGPGGRPPGRRRLRPPGPLSDSARADALRYSDRLLGRCPSGQRERAVNPSVLPTMVRIHPGPPSGPRPSGRGRRIAHGRTSRRSAGAGRGTSSAGTGRPNSQPWP